MKKGFTLIELLIVVAIIGILATVFIVTVNPQRNKAKDSNVKSNINSTRVAAELFYNENGNYTNVCNSPNIAAINNAIVAQGRAFRCYSDATGYCAEGDLSSGEWCADNTGYSGIDGSACSGTVFRCQ